MMTMKVTVKVFNCRAQHFTQHFARARAICLVRRPIRSPPSASARMLVMAEGGRNGSGVCLA